MTNMRVPDQDLLLAEDGEMHTAECVTMGWWLLDWDVDCVQVGVPEGGQAAAQAEALTFSKAVMETVGGVL